MGIAMSQDSPNRGDLPSGMPLPHRPQPSRRGNFEIEETIHSLRRQKEHILATIRKIQSDNDAPAEAEARLQGHNVIPDIDAKIRALQTELASRTVGSSSYRYGGTPDVSVLQLHPKPANPNCSKREFPPRAIRKPCQTCQGTGVPPSTSHLAAAIRSATDAAPPIPELIATFLPCEVCGGTDPPTLATDAESTVAQWRDGTRLYANYAGHYTNFTEVKVVYQFFENRKWRFRQLHYPFPRDFTYPREADNRWELLDAQPPTLRLWRMQGETAVHEDFIMEQGGLQFCFGNNYRKVIERVDLGSEVQQWLFDLERPGWNGTEASVLTQSALAELDGAQSLSDESDHDSEHDDNHAGAVEDCLIS